MIHWWPIKLLFSIIFIIITVNILFMSLCTRKQGYYYYLHGPHYK